MINSAVARRCLLTVGALSWLSACGGDSGAAGVAQADAAALSAERTTTALVDVRLKSRVAVVLDEIPKDQRAAAASFYLRKPKAFWVARAKHQVRHTNYRLVYRDFFYEASEGKRTLPLPPESVW